MDRGKKTATLEKLRSLFDRSASVVAVHQNMLTVSGAEEIRRKLRAGGASYFVAKNTLVRVAIADSEHAALAPLLKGQVALVFSQDVLSGPKIISESANASGGNITILGGLLGGKQISAKEVDALAKMPSMDELRAKFIGVIQAPAQKLAAVSAAPAAQLARVFNAYATK